MKIESDSTVTDLAEGLDVSPERVLDLLNRVRKQRADRRAQTLRVVHAIGAGIRMVGCGPIVLLACFLIGFVPIAAEQVQTTLTGASASQSADRARKLADLGRAETAADEWREAIRLKPTVTEYRLGLADLFRKGQDWRQLETASRDAIRADRQTGAFQNNLGDALFHQERMAEAAAAYAEAVRLHAYEAGFANNLGVALFRLGKFSDAEAAFRKSISLDRHRPHVHDNLGNALCRQARFSEAQTEYETAIRIDDSDGSYYSDLTHALLKQGKRSEALIAARNAIRHGTIDQAVCKELDLDPKTLSKQ